MCFDRPRCNEPSRQGSVLNDTDHFIDRPFHYSGPGLNKRQSVEIVFRSAQVQLPFEAGFGFERHRSIHRSALSLIRSGTGKGVVGARCVFFGAIALQRRIYTSSMQKHIGSVQGLCQHHFGPMPGLVVPLLAPCCLLLVPCWPLNGSNIVSKK